MTPAPLVTVAIPTHNGASFVEATIASVLAQEFQDFEILVCDDGSSDGTLEVVSRFNDRRLRIEAHSCGGIGVNWNRCLASARGRFVKVLPQDDLLDPRCLAESVALLERDPAMTLVFSRRHVVFDANDPASARLGRRYDVLDAPLAPLTAVNDGPTLLRRWAREGFLHNCIGEPAATLFPTELGRRLGFDTSLRQDLDYAMWIRLMARGTVGFLPQRRCTYRLHAASATRENLARDRLQSERRRMLENLWADPVVCSIMPELQHWLRNEPRRVLLSRIGRITGLRQIVGPLVTRFPEARALVAALLGHSATRPQPDRLDAGAPASAHSPRQAATSLQRSATRRDRDSL